jgi:5'-phosphate synthase pdxT subunit
VTVRVGVLALQGDFREHAAAVARAGGDPVLVRRPEDLDGLDALIIPGGESTTIGKLADRYGMVEPLRAAIRGGLPTLGTCAGMIFLAEATTSGAPQIQLGVLDVIVERNAFGRQVESFEAALEVEGVAGGPMEAVFIRAPWIAKAGEEVEILSEVDGHPVVVRQGNVLATAFHPELTGDGRLHSLLIDMARER